LRKRRFPNDTSFNEFWGLHNTGQTGGTPDADIDAPEAWSLRTNASNVIVAVIDSGVDYNHPDLAANMWHNPGEIPGNGIDDHEWKTYSITFNNFAKAILGLSPHAFDQAINSVISTRLLATSQL
jgi:subtilisin family serine protease